MQKILTVHESTVHFLSIQEMGHGNTNPYVIKGWFAHIHGKALEAHGILIIDFLFYDPVIGKFFALGFIDPEPGGINGKQIELSFFKSLECILSFSIESEFHGLKITGALGALGLAVPPIFTTLQGHKNTFVNDTQFIGPGDHRKLKVDFVKILIFKYMSG